MSIMQKTYFCSNNYLPKIPLFPYFTLFQSHSISQAIYSSKLSFYIYRTECGKCGKMTALSAENMKITSNIILCPKHIMEYTNEAIFALSEGSYVVIRPTVRR